MLNVFVKKQYFLCLFLGGLTGFCFAPFHFWWLLLIVIPSFYHALVSEHRFKNLLLKCWFFGYGYFFAGLYWISFAMRFEAEYRWFLIGLVLFGIPLFLSFFFLFFGMIFHLCRLIFPKVVLPICFILIWVWCELLRAKIFTGFPWNLVGYSFGTESFFATFASLVGVYGLGIFVLWGSFLGYFCAQIYKGHKIYISYLLGFGLVFLSCFFVIKNRPTPKIVETDLVLTIAQPSIDQKRKMNFNNRFNILNEYIELSKKTVLNKDKVNILLWPETAIQYDIFNNAVLRKQIMNELAGYDYLMTGIVRIEDKKYFNSLIVIDKEGGIVSYYDKKHLVPFGEYIPFSKYLRRFSSAINYMPVAIDHEGFSKGKTENFITIEGYKFLPLICYEAIFPNEVLARANQIDFIVNISNDGWYGNTTGPYQHLDMIKMRAIETNKPIIRASNTGISAFIDWNGKVIKNLKLNKKGFLTLNLTTVSRSDTIGFSNLGSRIESIFFNSFIGFVFILFLVVLRRVNVRR